MPFQEKVLIGEEGQPLITDFALAKVRYANHTVLSITYKPPPAA